MTAVNPPSDPIPYRVGVNNVIFSVDTAHNQLLVLLTQFSPPPNDGYWYLPGQAVQPPASLEATAIQLLRQTLPEENLYLEQLYTFETPNLSASVAQESTPPQSHTPSVPPHPPIQDWQLTVSYFALVRDATLIHGSPQASSTLWHSMAALPPLTAAQQQILTYGHQRLCSKLEYCPIAFDVLPETFTLSDLYQFYATVLGDNFADYSNFRTRLLKLGFLIDTGVKVSRGAGRPASLYRFDAKAFAPFRDKPFVFV